MGSLKYDRGSREEAIEWYGRAIRTVSAIRDQSKNAKLALETAYASRATALMELKRYPEAVRDWDRWREIESESFMRAWYLKLRALCLARAGDYARATSAFDELLPRSGEKPWQPTNWYGGARIYALSHAAVVKDLNLPPRERGDLAERYARRALELLYQAFDDRYEDVAQVKTEADFDSLRGRDDFKKLLVVLEAASKPKDK